MNARNFEGRTALHLMAGHGRLGCVVSLLSHGARADLQDADGNTALHVVTSLSVMQALVVFQAPLNITNKQVRLDLRVYLLCLAERLGKQSTA